LPACDPKIVSEYLHLFAKAKISPPFVKGAGGDFHRREVMVETEEVMEKIYRVVVERAGM
jgi:hypothetical protein